MAPSESSAAVPANNNWAPGAQKVDAGNIAKPFREEIRTQIQKLKEAGIEAPLLVGLLANSDPAAKKYAEWTGKACRADGIRYELREIKDAIDVEASLRDANDDPRVHGIIVYYPIFGQVESFSGESQDDYLNKELIQTNQNIKDIETISTQVCFNSDKIDNENENNYDNEEYIDTTETFDFQEINDFDSSQIEFDFNDSKKIEGNNPRSTDIKTPNTPEVGNKNVDENFELEMTGEESELEMTVEESELEKTGEESELEMTVEESELEMTVEESELEKNVEDDLNIKIKNINGDGSSNGENIEVEIKNETPFDSSIEETIKNSNSSSKEELKKFNYSFQNSIKRINEMDKQPAYKRLGYNIDQNVENDKKSPLTLDKDKNDEVQLRTNNSFLHDNVD